MKKLFLLLAAGSVVLSATAQQRLSNSVVLAPMAQTHKVINNNLDKAKTMKAIHDARTTATGATSRWYNYVDYLDTATGGAYGVSALYLWNDTTSRDAYSNGSGGTEYDFNTMVATASVLDPYFNGFDDGGGYFDSTENVFLTHYPTKNYTVDSIGIYGVYGFNPSKTGVVDTITISYTYGSGLPVDDNSTEDIWRSEFDNSFASSLLADYALTGATDTLWFNEVLYDSVNNRMSGTHAGHQTITISAAGTSTNTTATWGDTLSNGTFFKRFALTTPLSVPAGDKVAVGLSFKSGDASFAFGDTAFTGGTPLYNHNMFRQLIAYGTSSSSSTTPIFPTYSTLDHNEGLYKSLPNFENGWKNVYVPMYAWTSGTSAGDLQYPYVDVHVECPTCFVNAVPTVNTKATAVKAYPNPASNQLTIAYTLSQTATATVTLVNMLGETVATQTVNNTTNSNVSFNTSALASGVYMYVISANGERTTGHVSIAH